jgi:hypothetical protein
MKPALLIIILGIVLANCSSPKDDHELSVPGIPVDFEPVETFFLPDLPDTHLTELQPCDIIVKPNLAIFPGMLRLPGGITWGHAAIVIKGAVDTNETELLRKVIVFESQARDVEGKYQLRLTPAYMPGDDFSYASYNFSPEKLGHLYRLHFDLTRSQRDSIIAWILDKDDDLSSYRAYKRFTLDGTPMHDTGTTEYWYCSLLIWQAFYDVLGIDLDADKGLYVFPNDLVYSPYFNGVTGGDNNRVRF